MNRKLSPREVLKIKRFGLYLIRWQLSSPILFIVIYLIPDKLMGTIISNLIGSIIFFWVDRIIFLRGNNETKR